MNDSAPRIVAVGDLTADLIVEVPELPIRADDFLLAEQVGLEPGGSANLLILLARLGASAVALGTLGADLWGDQVYQILKSEGVDPSPIRREGTTSVALVLVDARGRHSFVGSYGKGKPLLLGDRETRIIIGADALFTSGYSLAEARLRNLTLQALEVAGQAGIPRFFDPGPAFKSLQPEVQRRALACSDVMLLTEEELLELSLSGPHTVVVKRGAAGCRVYAEGSEAVEIPGLTGPVRDTTAAGDCFAAGYIWAKLQGRCPEECARLANCAGAAAVGKLGGGRNVPTVEELRELILQDGRGIEI